MRTMTEVELLYDIACPQNRSFAQETQNPRLSNCKGCQKGFSPIRNIVL